MEYLLVMSLSGSTMTVMYLLLRRRLWDRVSARTFYLLARVAVLYYLIPLPYLKQWYRQALWKVLQRGKTYAARIPLTWTNYAVHADQRLYVNIYAILQMMIVIVWLAGACRRTGRQLLRYMHRIRFMASYAGRKMTDQHRKVITGFRKQYGVRRRIALYQGEDGEPTGTIGVFRPVITCGRELGSREAELMIRHEMVHIRRLDVLWMILLEFAMIIHWWNPVIRKLYRDFERVCECSCDETVMQGKSGEEVKEYLRLLIEEALQKKKDDASLRWKSSFGDNAERIKERMDNLMKNKRWNRFAAGVLVAALTFANSMTVFAYRDGFSETMTGNVSKAEIEEKLDVDTYMFVLDGADEEETMEFEVLEELEKLEICYDNQFTDEAGNVYPISGDDSVEPYCNHEYISGTSTTHRKLSGGGCEVKQYRSQRCVICGHVIQGEKINTITYEVCPH